MARDGASLRQRPGDGRTSEGVRAALAEIGAVPGCRVGLCARGLEGALAGARYGVGADEALPSASLIKVLVLAELLRRVDAGDVSLARRLLVEEEDLVEGSEMVGAGGLPAEVAVGRLAEGMISVSDNTATNALISLLGAGRINALALGLLERQRLTSKLPLPLPSGARFLHKSGDLAGVENDAGLVVHPAGAFALAVLTFGDLEGAAPRIGAAFSELCGAFGIAPTGA